MSPAEESLHLNRLRAGSFGDVAELYDRIRPAYPDALIDTLLAEHPTRVLDVGCGTGIVSRLFASRSCKVLGVEPDPRMAAVARRQGAAVETGTFEEWDAKGRRFDLLVAGQAWHWVDPRVGARKAAEVLRPGGRIGLFWNQSFPESGARAAMDEVYARITPQLSDNSVLLGPRHDRLYESLADSLRDVDSFVDVQLEHFSHHMTYSTEQWLELTSTHSDHSTLEFSQREALLAALRSAIDGLGGEVSVRYGTTLVTGQTLSA